MTDLFKCPACGHPQTCPCVSCQTREPTEKPWVNDGDLISCGACGLTKSGDWWLDQEYEFRGADKKNDRP